MSTRERILLAALDQFSTRGFDAVSVRDIAYAVGIKESSLYNHFTNKQAIFDEILREYANRWGGVFSGLRVAGEDGQFAVDERTVAMYRAMTAEQFMAMAVTIFDYYMTDEINVKLRKMLTIEQYRSREIAALFRRISFEESIAYQTELFAALMHAGAFRVGDPHMMALAFFAPIFLIFYQFGGEPERLGEAKTLFLRHVAHFNQTYGVSAAERLSPL